MMMSLEWIIYSVFLPVALLLLCAVIPPIRRFVYQKPWLTILMKNLYTFFGKPYFKVTVFHHREIGQVGVDAQYNIHFLYLLDGAYEIAGVDYYNRGLSEEAKIAIYMYDTMGSIADNYMPMPNILQEGMDDEYIPSMSMSDESIKQTVDLGKPDSSGTSFDIARG